MQRSFHFAAFHFPFTKPGHWNPEFLSGESRPELSYEHHGTSDPSIDKCLPSLGVEHRSKAFQCWIVDVNPGTTERSIEQTLGFKYPINVYSTMIVLWW
jgi:hypothetical protein